MGLYNVWPFFRITLGLENKFSDSSFKKILLACEIQKK